jgi:hypothetical protein
LEGPSTQGDDFFRLEDVLHAAKENALHAAEEEKDALHAAKEERRNAQER